jgi:hypothetical protein
VRSKTTAGLIGLLAGSAMVLSMTSTAQAATGTSTAAGKCANAVPAQYIVDSGVSAASRNPTADAAMARAQAGSDTLAAQRTGPSAAHDAQKAAALRTGAGTASCAATTGRTAAAATTAVVPNATIGSGYGYISWMYQYGQIASYYCGPATLEGISSTVPGPSPLGLNQDTSAAYMGTTADSGTSYSQMVDGLNQYVGVPDFGWNFYAYVWMDYTPTSTQRSAFLAAVQTDVDYNNTPIAANSWEEAGYAHLPGHPVNETIFHWFEIGGWDTNASKVWMADSATTVWSAVPAYSWFDTYTMGTILGGRGYAW